MSKPFDYNYLMQTVADARREQQEIKLEQQPSQPVDFPPVPQLSPSPQPKFQDFAHITGEVLKQFRHVTAADKIIKAGKLAREGGRVQQPQGDAKAIIQAANKARGRTDDDQQLPEKGTLARQIIDSAAKGVNWAR